MRTGVSFAKDWQLIKLARSVRRHDVARSLVRRLIGEASPDVLRRITSLAGRLGTEDGAALVAHTTESVDPVTLTEGLLLMWGIPCELADGDGCVHLKVRLDQSPALQENFADPAIAVPYITGFLKAIAPDASLSTGEDGLCIAFPPRD